MNSFKQALAANHTLLGLWCSLASPIATEIVGDTGFDWVLLDTEHAPNDPAHILALLQAMRGAPAEPIVRPAANDPVLIKRLMDVGARTLLIPMVDDAQQARAAVAATRYPPAGIRGVASAPRASRYGRTAGYHAGAADEACVLVQLETRRALTQLEAIAAVEGIDGIFIGPSDLAADLGHLANAGHPDVQAAITDAFERARAAGKPAGILTPVEADAKRYLAMGFTFVAVGSDQGLLASSSTALLNRMRPPSI